MSRSVYTDSHQLVVDTLIAARKRSGLKQAELAMVIGKGQSFVSNIERGQRDVSVLEFYAISLATGNDPAVMFAGLTAALPAKVDI